MLGLCWERGGYLGVVVGLTLLTRVHIFTLPSPNNIYHRSKQQEILAARRDPKKQQEYFKQVNFISVLLRLIW